jgi:3-deoxy-D-manno-octulosonic-acid transferase
VRAAIESAATGLLKENAQGLGLIVAGSTIEGEETALLEAWPQILNSDSRLVLVLAPRHPERFDAVELELERSSFRWIRRSDWPLDSSGCMRRLEAGEIVLLDTIGELASVYSLASVAFVGGSLVPGGGHNPLEPAQFGVPVVMGPHYANFRSIVDELRSHKAICIVQRESLAGELIDLLQNRAAADTMGARAEEVFEQQAGATQRCVEALRQLLNSKAMAEHAR